MEKILTEHPELEFVQIQLNYMDWDAPGVNSHEVYDTAARFGKDVIVMEPIRGGMLANIPEEALELLRAKDPYASAARWALRFAASHENVRMGLSGMSSLEQVEDNIQLFDDLKPLEADELDILNRAAAVIKRNIAIPCTACNYCTNGCPMNIPIPSCFSLYNMHQADTSRLWQVKNYYDRMSFNAGKASDCIGCGQCEGICPQHLKITDLLKDVAAVLEAPFVYQED